MLIPIVELLRTGRKTFPLNAWFPFETHDEKIYILLLVWTSWSCANSVIILIAIDTLMFVLITLISMKFKILKSDFLALKNFESSKVEDELRNLIHRHKNLINVSDKLQQIFSPSFLFNFVQSSFVICLTAFQYTTSSDATQFIFNGSYCAAILNQIWLLCYFGQKIIDSSENVEVGVYDCGWENFHSLKVRKALVTVIQRTQRPTRLTAMNFSEISLTSFTTVILMNDFHACASTY
jgi:odorant receptor